LKYITLESKGNRLAVAQSGLERERHGIAASAFGEIAGVGRGHTAIYLPLLAIAACWRSRCCF
jgi:hypothetical protein